MAINTGSIESLLRPGLAAVFGEYDKYPSEWTEIFDIYESDKDVEKEVEMKFLGLAQIRPEGSPTAMDTMGQRVITSYHHQYVALGFTITRQAIMDNLYKNRFPMQAKALKSSLAQTKERLGASILNNGFSANYPIGDGQPLFSTSHPIDTGTYANTFPVGVDLSEAALESALIAISKFKDQAGLTIKTMATKLIVPPENEFVAQRLLGSVYRTGTANNDISATYALQSVPQGARVNHFLTLPNSWYLLTDSPDGFKHYIREAIETDVYTDFSTDNLNAKAVERYSFGVSNARAAFASGGV